MTQAATTPVAEFDAARAEAFAERMVGVLNDAAIALMTSIGHRVGLFDAMAGLPPSTGAEVAAAAGLDERYVREWLAAMTVTRIVEHDPAAGTFRLPPEHAASLTRAAGPENLGIQAQYVGLLGTVEPLVAACFRTGGGVPYSAFGEFHRLMAEDSASVHDAGLVDAVLPLVPGLPDRLRAGIDVLDVGCGSGHAICLMAGAFPASRFTGYDISEEAIASARAEAAGLGLANARFETRDVAFLDERDAFDLVTAFDAIHDQARPAEVLACVARALRPDGVFLMVDIRASSDLAENMDHPFAPFLYTASTMHCMTVSLDEGGMGLGTMWGRQTATRMLNEAGFADVRIVDAPHDAFNDHYIARSGSGG